jgi:hypothetical protein
MNLVNRYLQAVGALLPKPRRGDIIAELRANILSQMEDREDALGRPLTDDEQAEILRHHGNPTVVAGRYREDNLGFAFGVQLIGPELFPFYKNVLMINMTIVTVILAGLLPVIARSMGAAITLGRVLRPLVTQFVVITLIFIAVDRNKSSLFDKWDPRKLPALKANPEDGPNAKNIFAFICLAVGTLWLVLTPFWPHLLLGPGALVLPALELKPMAGWMEFYWAISILLCAKVVLEFFRLFRWLPRRKAQIMDVVLRGIGLVIGALLLMRAPNYVTLRYPEVTLWANLNFAICLGIWMAFALWRAVRMFLSLLRERHQMLPARQY